jgi:hypothetical protein
MYTTPNLRCPLTTHGPKRRSSTGAAPTHRSRDDDDAPALDAALDDDDVDDELERARRDGWSIDDDTQDDVDGETRYVYSRAYSRVYSRRRREEDEEADGDGDDGCDAAMAMEARARASSCVVARRGGARASGGGDGVI